jgi:hypothetical protein
MDVAVILLGLVDLLSGICLEGQREPEEELGLNTLSVDR